MKVGTKSVLFGAHAALIHPWFVAAAWTKLYGFPMDWRLWLAFFVHDLGYWGLPNMDGDEGERHVELGAKIMHWLCDESKIVEHRTCWIGDECHFPMRDGWRYAGDEMREIGQCLHVVRYERGKEWHDFSLYHSRFYAKKDGVNPSRLCIADKLAICLEPWWFYLPRVWASGELWEYLARAGGMQGSKYNGEPEIGKYASMDVVSKDATMSKYQQVRHWHRRMTIYLASWVMAHKDGAADSWTPEPSHSTKGGK